MKKVLFFILAMGLIAGAAHANLVDNGGGLIYDTDLNITWLKDANYAFTTGYAQSLGNPYGAGNYGLMTFQQAEAWTQSLNSGGVTGWRLPTDYDITTGLLPQMPADPVERWNRYPPSLQAYLVALYGSVAAAQMAVGQPNPGVGFFTTTEPGHLYAVDGINSSNPGLFVNVMSSVIPGRPDIYNSSYWLEGSGTGYPGHYAFSFDPTGPSPGGTGLGGGPYEYAWAVHHGDVGAPVPEPGTILLFAPGLVGLIAIRRRLKK